ncbi:ribosome-recycling factor [Bonamia ostreae]|uniref:Ribosome-recycling factor n=1 Tax=Bonamia ostreae TaxID=126728 RepID=A0ABV2AG56_9EUKA
MKKFEMKKDVFFSQSNYVKTMLGNLKIDIDKNNKLALSDIAIVSTKGINYLNIDVVDIKLKKHIRSKILSTGYNLNPIEKSETSFEIKIPKLDKTGNKNLAKEVKTIRSNFKEIQNHQNRILKKQMNLLQKDLFVRTKNSLNQLFAQNKKKIDEVLKKSSKEEI